MINIIASSLMFAFMTIFLGGTERISVDTMYIGFCIYIGFECLSLCVVELFKNKEESKDD